MASLNIIHGEQDGTHFELTHRPLSIGREASRDIQLVDPKVSRRHAVIRFKDDRYYIRTAATKNGIKINGAKIEAEEILGEGDWLTMGDTEMIFTEMSEEDRANAVNARKQILRDDQTLM